MTSTYKVFNIPYDLNMATYHVLIPCVKENQSQTSFKVVNKETKKQILFLNYCRGEKRPVES